MGTYNEILNYIFGLISVLSIVFGFFFKNYQTWFWTFGAALLIFVFIGYFVVDHNKKISKLETKFSKIEESLNIYDRLNKLELRLDNMSKRGQAINLIEVIKWGLAAIIIYVFLKAILNS